MKLFCFGLSYTAQHLIPLLGDELEAASGTSRSQEKIDAFAAQQIHVYPLKHIAQAELSAATHILISIPPNEYGDLAFSQYGEAIKQCKNLKWVGYLSTTGVYGDHQGGWVDEDTPIAPNAERSKRRALAEQQWLDLHKESDIPAHVFRLAGIYGPGRSALGKLKAGKFSLTDKPGQYFSRIHVADIAGILAASMKNPAPGEIYNVCDDLPCGSLEVQQYAAKLLNIELPPAVPYEQAQLSAMQKEFYSVNRRVRNAKLKQALAYNLLYPSYKEGLTAILNQT